MAEFLPPQPAGPEPELGPAPRPETPSGAWQPPQHAQQTWQQPPPGHAYAPRPVEPDNGPAVAGFVLSTVAGGLLVLSGGLSSLISLGCAITGMVYSRKGKRKVEAGETRRHDGLAKAGWIIGIVSLVLAVLATVLWTYILVDDEAREEFEREFEDSESVRAAVCLAGAAGRVLLG